MSQEKENSQLFKPYTVNYISDLLNIVNKDVQDNTPISDEDYLKVALKACHEFNEEFGDNSFDVED